MDELKLESPDEQKRNLLVAKQTIEQCKKGFEEAKENVEQESTKYGIHKIYANLELLGYIKIQVDTYKYVQYIDEEIIWQIYKPVFMSDYYGDTKHFSTEDKLTLQNFRNRAQSEQMKEMRANMAEMFKMIKDLR